MSEASTPTDPKQISELERKIENLRAKFEALQREFGSLDQEVKVFSEQMSDIDHYTMEAASILRYFASRPQETRVEDLSGAIDCILSISEIAEMNEPQKSKIASRAWSRVQSIVKMIPQTAKRKNMPPGELLYYLISRLGKQFLQANLEVIDVANDFGTEEAVRWKTLIEG